MNNLRKFISNNKIVIEKLLIIFLFFSFSYVFFNYIFVLVAPFVIGYAISIFLEPVVRALMDKFNFKRSVSAVISIIIMIFVIGGSIFLIISNIVDQGVSLYKYHQGEIVYMIDIVMQKTSDIISKLFFYVPTNNIEMVASFFENIVNGLTSVASDGIKRFSVSFIKFVPKLFVYITIGFLSSFFFIKDRYLIKNIYRNCVPNKIKKNVTSIKEGLSYALFGYIKSQCIIMCVTATICLTGLLILKNPYALFLSVAIAVVDILPLFGSGFVLWPLSFISFLEGDIKTGIGSLVIYATVQVTRQLIEPKILGSQIGLHPLITLMSVYSGVIIFGVFGIVLGPMSAIIIKTIWTTNNIDL